MRKVVVFISLLIIVLAVLSGCTDAKKECISCGAEPQYKAKFIMSGSVEYLCESCYYERNENPTFDDTWIVERIY